MTALQAEWEAILQEHDLGLYRGERLGIHRLMYIGTYRDLHRAFRYSIEQKQTEPNPYYEPVAKTKLPLEVQRALLRMRKRLNKRAQLTRKRAARIAGGVDEKTQCGCGNRRNHSGRCWFRSNALLAQSDQEQSLVDKAEDKREAARLASREGLQVKLQSQTVPL